MSSLFDYQQLAYAANKPQLTATFKQNPEDFQVVEQMPNLQDEAGEHLWVKVRKRGQNTIWLAEQLAQQAQIELVNVGYAGMKDRNAVTEQWFSLHLPGKSVQLVDGDGFQILDTFRQRQKLRRGAHQGNQFVITLRDTTGGMDEWEQSLQTLADRGVPNYFGEQRFGRDMGNLTEVEALVAKGELRGARTPKRGRGRGSNPRQQNNGIYLSSARSWLFNIVLSSRVADATWQTPILGEEVPTCPLWGRGRTLAPADLAQREADVLQPLQHWCDSLEHAGLQQERRANVLMPIDLKWEWIKPQQLQLHFGLENGQFATALLRELAILNPVAMV